MGKGTHSRAPWVPSITRFKETLLVMFKNNCLIGTRHSKRIAGLYDCTHKLPREAAMGGSFVLKKRRTWREL